MEAVKGIKAGLVETSGGQEINRGRDLRTVHDIPSHPRTAKARTSEEVGLCQVFLILNTVRKPGNSYSTPMELPLSIPLLSVCVSKVGNCVANQGGQVRNLAIPDLISYFGISLY